MSKPKRVGSIEIDQDLEFQKRSWAFQRVSWTAMLLIAVAALLGAFGNGPLASAHSGDDASIAIDYERFVRLNSPEEVTITFGSAVATGKQVSIWVDREWLSRHDVKGIVPEPSESTVTPYAVIYTFNVDSQGQMSKIELDLEPRSIGRIEGKAGLVGGKTVQFNQFSYP